MGGNVEGGGGGRGGGDVGGSGGFALLQLRAEVLHELEVTEGDVLPSSRRTTEG